MSKILVLDVGGSSVKYALMDKDEASILEKGSIPVDTSKDAPKEEMRKKFVGSLADLYEKYADEAEGIAMSLPGNIDSNKGCVLKTPGALWYNKESNLAQEIQDAVKARCGKTILVTMENDGKAAALAELWKGNLKDCDSGVVMVIGTGIGGGVVLDHKLVKGKDFFAGELSYVLGDLNHHLASGCAAIRGSSVGMAAKIAAAKGEDPAEFDGRKAFELINHHDEEAYAIFDETMSSLAGLAHNLNVILNPEKILFGGGISQQPIVVETIREKMNHMLSDWNAFTPDVEIDVCKFLSDSNLIGALYNYSLVEQAQEK